MPGPASQRWPRTSRNSSSRRPSSPPNKDKHRRLLVVAKARTQDWDGMEAIAFETLKADRTDYLMYHLIAVARRRARCPTRR